MTIVNEILRKVYVKWLYLSENKMLGQFTTKFLVCHK